MNNLKPGSTATVASATAPDTKDNKQYLLLRSKNEVIAVFHLCNKKPALKAGDEVVVNNNGTLHTLQPKEEAEQG